MSDPSGVADRIAAAKLWLVTEATDRAGSAAGLPYLATALYALVLVPCDDVPTLAADEHWRLYANPAWVLGTATPEIGAELAHVTWHLLLAHADRARDLRVDQTSAREWGLASDLTVHRTTGADGVASDALTDGTREARERPAVQRLGPDRSAEEYFATLSALPVTLVGGAADPHEDPGPLPACGSACDGVTRDHELPPDAPAGGLDRTEADDVRKAVAIDYAGHVTGRGTEPADARRWAKQVTDPEIPWQPLLARAVRRAVAWTSGRTHPTWQRPSRRAAAVPGILLPGMRRPVAQVAIVVDTSGSVDDVLLGKALGEVHGALTGLGVADARVSVYACDASVGAVSRVRRARDVTLVGGGGTDMRVGIRAAAEGRPRPDVLVVFTDGYTPWPVAPPPGTAVVAAMLGRHGDALPPSPTWATRVECVLR